MAGLDHIPFWILGILLVAILSIVIELGYQVGRRVVREEGMSKHPIESAVTTAIFGLLAFMMAFTFGQAASRYAKSRDLAVTDATQVGTLYRMADYLPAQRAPQARILVREYLEVRIDAINKQDPEQMDAAVVRSTEIHDELWKIGATERPDRNSIRANPFVTALGKVIETDATRQATALSNRLPSGIWWTLGMLALLATTLLGLNSGLHGRRSRLVATVFIAAYSVVFILIVDLDRPFKSIFRLGDPAAERVLRSME